MKLYNSLNKKIEALVPITKGHLSIYSCGPTVYDQMHIGNLRAFIIADTLRRVAQLNGLKTKHVMNITDVDDKTIARAKHEFPNDSPKDALKKLAKKYTNLFLDDMGAVGNDMNEITLLHATDNIAVMQKLISRLVKQGFAYIADDGIYFSISKYRQSGKKYGQLVDISEESVGESRINNDEYDKDSPHDFALWKKAKTQEPRWDFDIDGQNIEGRPGWHIECSAMGTKALGQPFDIHTGGVDLKFPHHENEIAQSTAGESKGFANYFLHNEHLLVDGRKMSKSLNNFYTLEDIVKKGFDPLAFRLLILQSHYQSQMNFTWEALEAAQNTLLNFHKWADMRFQKLNSRDLSENYSEVYKIIHREILSNLNIPIVLGYINGAINRTEQLGSDSRAIEILALAVDQLLGFDLCRTKDINNQQRNLLDLREKARKSKDFTESDEIRKQLEEQGIGVNDTPHGQIWYRL